MLNLGHNQIEEIIGIEHLNQLVFLDLSSNKIKEFNADQVFPKSINILRLNDNPVEKEDPNYRKQCVLALDWMTEMDRIKVVQAERMVYKGLLPPSSFNVKKKLEEFKREKQEEQARQKMDFELYVEMMDEQGISGSQRINNNLIAYEKLDGEEKLQAQFGEIMHKMKGTQSMIHDSHKDRFKLIEQQFEKVLERYPGSAQRGKVRKHDNLIQTIIEEHEKENDEEDDDDNDEDGFNQYSKDLDVEIAQRIKRAEKSEIITEEKLAIARGD